MIYVKVDPKIDERCKVCPFSPNTYIVGYCGLISV